MSKRKAQRKSNCIGRPSKYDQKKTPRLAYLFIYGGATEQEICDHLSINSSIWQEWKGLYTELSEAIERAKDKGRDIEVENALLKRALGYEVSEQTVETKIINGKPEPVSGSQRKRHVEPNTPAISLWLRNRRPDKWRDQVDMIHSGVIDQRIVFYLPVNGRDMHLQPIGITPEEKKAIEAKAEEVTDGRATSGD